MALQTQDTQPEAFRQDDFQVYLRDTLRNVVRLALTTILEEEVTGLIGAAVRMRPSKSAADLEVSSLSKKFKDKKFAAGCSRDVIEQGAVMLGWGLDKLFDLTIQAMRACEADVNRQMEEI